MGVKTNYNPNYILPPVPGPGLAPPLGTGNLGTNPGIFTGGGGLLVLVPVPVLPVLIILPTPAPRTPELEPLEPFGTLGLDGPSRFLASNAARAAAMREPTDPEPCLMGEGGGTDEGEGEDGDSDGDEGLGGTGSLDATEGRRRRGGGVVLVVWSRV